MTGAFRRLHVLVEGQTEEVVVNTVIGPHLRSFGWHTTYSLVKTKRPASGPSHKGGITSWRQVQTDIRLLLGDSSLEVLTTMFDYYAFPVESPAWPIGRQATSTSGLSTSNGRSPRRSGIVGFVRTWFSTSWRRGFSPLPTNSESCSGTNWLRCCGATY
ncbi:hypothetical protein F4560_007516 [Saccharothrix ecbatanensis]|uniref:DUF4276 family protein n=1 Tax=Saccharothrix ecbatanensis TaxID=1105145 RepID=A0A7W9M564_9PSEU|nr:hypothetical protein [Saccharothrix ecbatanensis]